VAVEKRTKQKIYKKFRKNEKLIKMKKI